MNSIDSFLRQKLLDRYTKGNFRKLTFKNLPFDFTSNDYLGLARNGELFDNIQKRIVELGIKRNGSGGSRLLSGNHELTEQLEHRLAALFQSEGCLLFNSGYDANLALISSIPQKGDSILYDQLSHVCLKEGAWLSKAESHKYLHNDLIDLEKKLADARGNKFIVTESVFSMDGDFSPIEGIIKLADKYDAQIILDEAHSTACFGTNGNGWLCEQGLQDRIFARVYTFGKALGAHGACICGSKDLIDYLINFGRTFIYTTALPLHSIITIDEAFHYVKDHPQLRSQLDDKIKLFRSEARNSLSNSSINVDLLSKTAIQPMIVSGNEAIKRISANLQQEGYDVRPILAPSVPPGLERLRITIHVYNSDEEIVGLLQELSKEQ
ncbi:MAG: 8-amino-7-oxononanoate synthase [Bacteroidetes bacterium]|nr:8-amino-7-oxononanoate synthase [Bacteroidota bacterium]MDA1119180.1 8-amino-7-oxononanoate synthase [Bacteroidota bacterium]